MYHNTTYNKEVPPTSVDEYITTFPATVQEQLTQMRTTIKEEAPDAEEAISYGMPAYKLYGNLVYFAGFKKHIGFYPGAGAITTFAVELAVYKYAKGSVQFPINQPLPLDLVRRMVRYRVAQNEKKTVSSR